MDKVFKARASQEKILQYTRGWMGISAVPGSGKTHTLSALAAKLILEGHIRNDQEILVVTLVNSAVDNFSSRIAEFIKAANLLENIGYRVRTLHGLAHDIVRERPDLAGISNQFSIIDEAESTRMIETIANSYLHEHHEIGDFLLNPEVSLDHDYKARKQWPELVASMNQDFIKQSKDDQLEPEDILARMEKLAYHDPLVEMGVQVYSQYQRGLRFRNALDFADLIRLAYRVLENDSDYLARLQDRWPYVLEDEAQDSSSIQEKILQKLVGEHGNWVRVGDPNQAIYETFTTANPKYLRNFLKEDGVLAYDLPNSGRSSRKIIALANHLVEWTSQEHPNTNLREALAPPYIKPTDPGDPQPNPADIPNSIYIRKDKMTPDAEISFVAGNLKRWLPQNQDETVAVLCPIAKYGEQLAEELQKEGIEIVELLKVSSSTRKTSRTIERVLQALAEPSSAKKLAPAFSEVASGKYPQEEARQDILEGTNFLQRFKNLEDFIYPQTEENWLRGSTIESLSETTLDLLSGFRDDMILFHQAASLPIDQLVLTIGQTLFTSPPELALCHKLALMLEFSAGLHPEFRLSDFASELTEISSNARKFEGFSDDDLRFNPDSHKGKVFISTYHKAKGMEWDRVYLLSVNNYDFPSAEVYDKYIGEKWFIRNNLNPQAELLGKLEALFLENRSALQADEGTATLKARVDYALERLRLLFVGITRAKQTLGISWNNGRYGDMQMAAALVELINFLEETNETST